VVEKTIRRSSTLSMASRKSAADMRREQLSEQLDLMGKSVAALQSTANNFDKLLGSIEELSADNPAAAKAVSAPAEGVRAAAPASAREKSEAPQAWLDATSGELGQKFADRIQEALQAKIAAKLRGPAERVREAVQPQPVA